LGEIVHEVSEGLVDGVEGFRILFDEILRENLSRYLP
jgi:hypothetical protein